MPTIASAAIALFRHDWLTGTNGLQRLIARSARMAGLDNLLGNNVHLAESFAEPIIVRGAAFMFAMNNAHMVERDEG